MKYLPVFFVLFCFASFAYSQNKPKTTVDPDWATYTPVLNEVAIVTKLHFEPSTADWKKGEEVYLDQLADLMLKKPSLRIEISSHIEPRTAKDFARRLSDVRAGKVEGYLFEKGIATFRLSSVGSGTTRPLEAYQERIEIKFLQIKDE